MATITETLPDVGAAVLMANQSLFNNSCSVSYTHDASEPKKPVFLELTDANGTTRKIGIIYLVRLVGIDWDNVPWTEIVRSTEQVAHAILYRVALFFGAVASELYISPNGTAFDFDDSVKINDDLTFSIKGITVTSEGSPLLITEILSEGIIEIRIPESGDAELFDAADFRKGKRMFVRPDGAFYRR